MEIDSKILIAVLAGDATDAERALVERWRAASRANEVEYQRQQRMWDILGLLTAPEATESNIAASATAVTPESRRFTARHPNRRTLGRHRGLSAVVLSAAAVLIVVALARLWPGGSDYEPLALTPIVTGPGEMRTAQLRDGTVVRLGPESRLEFRSDLGPRDMSIEGQAYFVVPGGRPDAFRVHSKNRRVAVVGTRFEVDARGEDVQVLVVEGEVEFSASNRSVSLTKGQAGMSANHAPPVVDSIADVYAAIAWIGDFAAYDETPLVDIATEFDRRFGYVIDIADPALASRTVSGTMRDQTPEDMAAHVCIAVDARCTFETGRVRMELGPLSSQPSAAEGTSP